MKKIGGGGYVGKCYVRIGWGDGYEGRDGVEDINKEYMEKVVEYSDVVKN